jgi:hypothetical protein
VWLFKTKVWLSLEEFWEWVKQNPVPWRKVRRPPTHFPALAVYSPVRFPEKMEFVYLSDFQTNDDTVVIEQDWFICMDDDDALEAA